MAKGTPQAKFKALQTTLNHLRMRSLPADTRDDLDQALQRLNELPDYLVASDEQIRLAALYRVSQTLGASLDLDEVLNQVMDAVISLTNAERGFLMLRDVDTDQLRLRAARNFEHETLERENAVSRSVIDMVVQKGAGVVTTNAQTDPRFANQQSVVLNALRSIMCTPLRAHGQIIGVVYVDNRAQTGLFTPSHLELLNAFAAQAAIAIENAHLYARTDHALNERVSELETLTQIDRQLNARLDLDHILEITYHWAIQGTEASQAWIILKDDENNQYRVAIGSGEELTNFTDLLQSLQDTGGEAIPIEEKLPRLGVAIIHSHKVIGAIIVERDTPFSPSARQFLQRLAAHTAIAMENTRLYDAIQQANLAKIKFISLITHELRIPMTAIKGYTDILRREMAGAVNEQQHGFLDIISKNVERMAALVSDLSDISRIESGRLKLECKMIPVVQHINDMLHSLQHKFEEKKQTVEVELPDDLPSVYADPNRLVQVLINLVNNASKYTPPGGSIRIRASAKKKWVRIEVSDTGIGIKPEDQARLFEQFFRSEDPAVREQQGWGLGLNLTRRLVELMNGKIGMESQLGKGSSFWFTLPREENK